MSEILTSIRLSVLSIIVCSVLYPLAIWGFASTVVPEKSRGSLIANQDGQVVGSNLLAQSFSQPHYFWPRPSAVDYNASGAGGSNLSPTNSAITERASVAIQKLPPTAGQLIPADIVTTSGSGLDPHITNAAAQLQVARVAAARNLPVAIVKQMVEQANDSPTLVWLGGEPLVNVLRLNLLLDAAATNRHSEN